MNDYGFPVSVFSLAELFGIPGEDRELFLDHAWKLLRGRRAGEDRVEESNSSDSDPRSGLIEYFSELVDERREDLRDGIILHLLNETSCNDAMTRSDVISNCDMMMVGGFVPALHLTNMVYCLDEQNVLRGNTPSKQIIKKIVEETFRYRSTALAVPRLAKSSTRLGDREISKGDQLMIWLASANRDGDVFNQPESFVLDRNQNNHLAFGAGIHYCIGAQIARMEAGIMLSELFNHIDQLFVRDDGTTPYMDPVEFGFDSLFIDGD
jgi:cytochrome P450